MKIFFIGLIILQYIEIIFSVIPTWKFDSSTQKLLNQTENFIHEYIVTSGIIWANQNNGNYDQFVFKRRIYKEEGEVKQENILYINGNFFAYTPFDDIETIYRNNNLYKYFVCPKGKYHVYTYSIDDGNNWVILKPDNGVNEESNWDLKCYHQLYEDYLYAI